MKNIAIMSMISYIVSSLAIGLATVAIFNTAIPVSTLNWGLLWYFTPIGFMTISSLILLISIMNALIIYLMVK